MILFFVPEISVLSEFRMRLFSSLLKCVFPASTKIFSKYGVVANGLLPIQVTLLGIVIEDKAVQPENASAPIEVKLLGDSNVTLVKLVQLANAIMPISVTVFGMMIEVKLVQSRKVAQPIKVSELGD
jgi:hypothetical protein